jgi:hypothetical protein
MGLEIIEWNNELPLPEGAAEQLIREGERRVDEYLDQRGEPPASRFLPSDFRKVYGGIKAITDQDLALGRSFCELGAGFAVAAGLAAMLGWEARGIERDEDLVPRARQLMADFALPVELFCDDYVPMGFGVYHDQIGESLQLVRSGDEADAGWYENLNMAFEDFDLVFAYPWPGETEMIMALFEAAAAEGALLLLYHGLEDLTLHRKVYEDDDD